MEDSNNSKTDSEKVVLMNNYVKFTTEKSNDTSKNIKTWDQDTMPIADQKYQSELQEFLRFCFNEKGEEIDERLKVYEELKKRNMPLPTTESVETKQKGTELSC